MSRIRVIAPPFLVAVAFALLTRIVAGASLGLYFGGIAMALILLPPLVAHRENVVESLLAAAAVINGVAIVWLVCSMVTPQVRLLQWLQAYAVLIAVALAGVAVTLALRRLLNATVAAALTTTLLLAWLSFPIGLSPALSGRGGATVLSWLAPAHPLFALNRIFIDFGLWTQQPLMYQLTTLGQDVPYALPRSIVPCVLTHLAIAALLAPLAWARRAASDPPPSGMSPVA